MLDLIVSVPDHCLSFYYASVSEMVNNLEWRGLEQRHADPRLYLYYKVVYGLVAVPLPDYWIFESLATPMRWLLDNCKLPGIITSIPFFHGQ